MDFMTIQSDKFCEKVHAHDHIFATDFKKFCLFPFQQGINVCIGTRICSGPVLEYCFFNIELNGKRQTV